MEVELDWIKVQVGFKFLTWVKLVFENAFQVRNRVCEDILYVLSFGNSKYLKYPKVLVGVNFVNYGNGFSIYHQIASFSYWRMIISAFDMFK